MNEPSSPRHTPRAYGSDRLERRADGSLLLTCEDSKGWLGRRPASRTAAEHPGTAVRWGEEVFEVLDAAPLPSGAVRYRLAAWEQRHAIRALDAYDEASERARAAERAERSRNVRRRRPLSILLAPLLGHLPAPAQEKMEGDFGAAARAMTLVSALPLLALGFAGLVARLAESAGAAPFLPWLAERPFVSLYLFLESAVRAGYAFLTGDPIGSIPGTLVWEIWRRTRGLPAPVEWKRTPPPSERADEDRFRMVEPLLALLPPRDQERLAARFGFDAPRWGRVTSAVLLVVSGANVAASLVNLAAGKAGAIDLVWLLAAGALLFEQLARRRRLARGLAAGSVLGLLVRPLARSLLS